MRLTLQGLLGPLLVVVAACEVAPARSEPLAPLLGQREIDWVGRTYGGTVGGTVDGQPFSTTIAMTFTTKYNADGDFGGTWQTGTSEPGTFQVETARDGSLLLVFYDARRCIFAGTARRERGGKDLAGRYETTDGSLCSEAVSAGFTVTWDR